MAAGEHSCTRRALLGAAVAEPLAAAPLSPSSPTPASAPVEGEGGKEARRLARWARALAGVERAEGEMAAFKEAEAGLGTRSFAAQWELDETFSDLVVAFNDALRRLMRTPAPNLPALAAKIALAVDHDVATLTGGEACMAALKRDGERLCGTLSRNGQPASCT